MDVYNRGQWEFDGEAQEFFTRISFFGAVETETLYDENQAIILGRTDGMFIALRASLINSQGEYAAKYPYIVSFCLQTYTFNFMVPDFVSILMFCQEFHQIIAEQNTLLNP